MFHPTLGSHVLYEIDNCKTLILFFNHQPSRRQVVQGKQTRIKGYLTFSIFDAEFTLTWQAPNKHLQSLNHQILARQIKAGLGNSNFQIIFQKSRQSVYGLL